MRRRAAARRSPSKQPCCDASETSWHGSLRREHTAGTQRAAGCRASTGRPRSPTPRGELKTCPKQGQDGTTAGVGMRSRKVAVQGVFIQHTAERPRRVSREIGTTSGPIRRHRRTRLVIVGSIGAMTTLGCRRMHPSSRSRTAAHRRARRADAREHPDEQNGQRFPAEA